MPDLQWVKEVKVIDTNFSEGSLQRLNEALKEGWKLLEIARDVGIYEDDRATIGTTNYHYILGR